MGVPGNANALLLRSAAAAGGYQVSRSLRFNGSVDNSYLSRTPASAGNRKTWTWSGWVKRTKIGSGINSSFFRAAASGQIWFKAGFQDDTISVSVVAGGAEGPKTSAVFRDTSAWYHIVIAFDTTQATAANRQKLYVNGVQISFTTDLVWPNQNQDYQVNNTVIHYISDPAGGEYFDGYLADVWFVDGSALTPSDFAETDATTGQWIPKAYTGSKGTNGFHLEFADNSSNTATTLGKDTANSNNFTPNNFSVTAGVGNDSLTDVPTSYGSDSNAGGEVRGNYCTWNPLDKNGNVTLKNGNLDADNNVSTWSGVRGTIGVATGKWYWEYTLTGPGYAMPGLAAASVSMGNYAGASANGYSMFSANGALYANGSYTGTTLSSFTTNDVFGVAFDADNGKLWFAKNGVWWSSGNPAAGTNPLFSSISSGTYFPTIAFDNTGGTNGGVANFGQRPFAYTAPSGFKALCDTNLPAPVVAKPSTVMDVALYTGNGSTQTVSGLQFNPDLVWIKNRNGANNNVLQDAVRGFGATKNLSSNQTQEEGADTDGVVTGTTSSGFTVSVNGGSGNGTNRTNYTYVGWVWDAGATTSSNGSGSITSQVRANASAGFSVLTATTPTSGSSFSVGHGLGVAPAFAIFKDRGYANSWGIYHKSITTTTGGELLFTTAAAQNYGWFPSAPTSTTFTLSVGGWGTGASIVGYLWTPVAGYSSFGSYTGNGSSDGPFVYTGFKVKWLMIKRTDSTSNWYMIDASRSPYNEVNDLLYAEQSLAETVDDGNNGIDFLSNGFKLRKGVGGTNVNGSTLIYAAFAENPFAYARAR